MGAERDGTIGIRGKAMATGSALAKMAELVRQKCSDVSALKRPLVISYCNCRERAEQVRNMIFPPAPSSASNFAGRAGSPPFTPTTAASC
jgi:hypothetical protein